MMRRSGWKVLMLLAAALVMVLRAPVLLREPRIWAEEGTVYLAYAYGHAWWEALLAPHQGYYSLFPNLVTMVAAHTLDILHWPLLTTWASFGVQLLPLALILWGRSWLWEQDLRRVLGVLLVLFTLNSAETWLNTINSQFHLALVAFLVLLEEAPHPATARAWIYRLLLLVATLTGPVASFFLPLFLYRAWRERQLEAWLQAAIALLGAAVQGGVLLLGESNVPAAARWASLDLPTLGAIAASRTVVVPFLGLDAAGRLADWLAGVREQDAKLLTGIGLGMLGLLAALLIWLASEDRRRQWCIAAGYLLLTALSIVAAIVSPGDPKFVLVFPGGAIRYFWAPSVLMGWLALSNVSAGRPKALRVRSLLSLLLVLLAVTWGALSYRETLRPFVNPYWGRWWLEVTRWRQDPDTELRIWPQNWTMQLPRRG